MLLGLGIVLFVLETQVTSHGLLSVGGIICFALGASALYTQPGGDPTLPLVQVATPLVVITTGTTAVLMGLITVAAIRTRRMVAPAGSVGVPVPAGAAGVVQAPLVPLGTVFMAGEPWSARAVDGTWFLRGAAVRLVGFDGLIALVEPAPDPSPATPAAAAPADRP